MSEYEFVKRILYVQIPLLTILTVFYFLNYSPLLQNVRVLTSYAIPLLLPAQRVLLFSVAAGLIWFFINHEGESLDIILQKHILEKYQKTV